MTQYPNQNPVPYYSAAGSPNPRPTVITVIAIIGIVLSGWALLGGFCGIVGLLVAGAAMKAMPGNPAMDVIRNNSLIFGWTLVSGAVALALAVLLLASSIGALGLKPWARMGMIYYAVAALACNVISFIVQLAVVAPARHAAAANMPGASVNGIAEFFLAFLGLAVGIVWCAAILVVMRQPAVVAAFEGGAAGNYPAANVPPTNYPQA